MNSAPVLVIAHPREVLLWEDALRARKLEPIRADRGTALREAVRQSPAAIVVSEKLPRLGALRVIRDLRRDPATREAPVVLVGVQPFSTAQRLRLGTGAPDATVAPGSSPEAVAEAVAEAMKRGRVPPPELTPAQQAGMRYSRVGTVLMMMGVFLSIPQAGARQDHGSWFLLLIPLGGLVTDIGTGRVDGRKKLLSWQGWAAIAFMAVIALGIVFMPGFFGAR